MLSAFEIRICNTGTKILTIAARSASAMPLEMEFMRTETSLTVDGRDWARKEERAFRAAGF